MSIFVAWIVTFYRLMLVVTRVIHEADNAYSIRSIWLCYPISRKSIKLLIINLSHFPNLLDLLFSFMLYFLRVLSLKTTFSLILKFCSVFPWGHVVYKIVLAI